MLHAHHVSYTVVAEMLTRNLCFKPWPNPCWICGRQSGSWTCFSTITSIFILSHITSPLLRTHVSLIYHGSYIKFSVESIVKKNLLFSSFSFPLSYMIIPVVTVGEIGLFSPLWSCFLVSDVCLYISLPASLFRTPLT